MANNRKSRKEKSGYSYYELFNSAGGNSSRSGVNKFLNDGSFLENFKKKQQEHTSQADDTTASNDTTALIVKSSLSSANKNGDSNINQLAETDSGATTKTDVTNDEPQPKKPAPLPFIGKRRGGKVLPTGMVKKLKKEEEEETNESRTDAWSHYMKEVKRYQQQSCEDEGKTRPLVK